MQKNNHSKSSALLIYNSNIYILAITNTTKTAWKIMLPSQLPVLFTNSQGCPASLLLWLRICITSCLHRLPLLHGHGPRGRLFGPGEEVILLRGWWWRWHHTCGRQGVYGNAWCTLRWSHKLVKMDDSVTLGLWFHEFFMFIFRRIVVELVGCARDQAGFKC